MKIKIPFLIFILALPGSLIHANVIKFTEKLQWSEPHQVNIDGSDIHILSFNNAYYPADRFLPAYQQSIFFPSGNTEFLSLEFINLVFDSTDISHLMHPEDLSQIHPEPDISSSPIVSRGRSGVHISFYPFAYDYVSGKVFRLTDFELSINFRHTDPKPEFLKNSYTQESVLASGDWYKFSVAETGVHKITYNDLVQAGLNPANIRPENIRLYGNGGGMLPEPNSGFRHDDLVENAIIVVHQQSNSFNQQDYILFFGESPHQWSYSPNSTNFQHLHNIYDDHNYYFLTTNKGVGKRISTQPETSEPATDFVTTFNDFMVHQQNSLNLMKSGRQWYGEKFDVILTREFNFNFPNRVLDSPVYLHASVASRSLQATSFTFNINANTSQTNVLPIGTGSYPAFAREATMSQTISSNTGNITAKITYNKSPSLSTGWLNFIRLHAERQLLMTGDQMAFRNLSAVGSGRISEFKIGNASTTLEVWDVTDPANVMQQQANQQGNQLVYRLYTDQLREFIAFEPAKALLVEFVEKVPNQNLHGISAPNLLIVTSPLFLEQANRLADFHTDYSGLNVMVATTPQIYNEFSSGKQDISAIRDFTRMLYERSNNQEFKYLLLFGDASYDFKNRVANNTNFVPVWMSHQSLDPIQSYVTDDFYGFLDSNEGGPGTNILDIGIGRLPVGSVEEAISMVDKIIHYASNTQVKMADWRNYICFVADDGDGNLHMSQAETLALAIDTLYPSFNLRKIYLDAYQQVSVPGGKRYPEVNAEINRRVQQGALIVNYTGHGGVLGWSEERVLELTDIRNWTNFDMMPVFITATCEFAYFDDPARVSAGELALINPKGGAIALFTTSRPTLASLNFPLNRRLFEYSFQRKNNEYLRLGDIIRLAKQNSGNDPNARKFLLLGDPALKLAIPEYSVVTTHVNELDINFTGDTLRALSHVNISGVIVDLQGNVIEDFNGILTPTVFDKEQKITTLANNGGNPYVFKAQQNIIYKGSVSVINGHFNFSFIVPKDISYSYGNGKISYYATDGFRDAHGSERRIIIGGYNESAVPDISGPEIDLFINDDNFEFGGITNENPILLAFVRDKSGINTSGIGIGHDITAVLNNETDKAYNLNDFYRADQDTYQSGTIRYPFFNLPEGRHHLRLKVWDIHNNPAEEHIEFIVAGSAKIALVEVLNYPNPFRDRTNFVIAHNQAGATIDFEIYIYSIDGRLRKVIKEKIRPGGYRSEPFDWDGRGDDGQLLESGTYIYRVVMRNPDSGVAEKGNKLVIIR